MSYIFNQPFDLQDANFSKQFLSQRWLEEALDLPVVNAK